MNLKAAIIKSLTDARRHSPGEVPPRAVLWPDEAREWEAMLPDFRREMPELFTLGPYAPELKQGPMVFLLPLVDGKLEGFAVPPGSVPVLYLPGIGRSMLRDISSLPRDLQPLAALQYRSAFWSQENGKDWTRLAFAVSGSGGVGWTVARDDATRKALEGAYPRLLYKETAESAGRTLTAGDFNETLVADHAADLLRWLQDPADFKKSRTKDVWSAFRATVKEKFAFDPEKKSALDGLGLLARKESDAWRGLWDRFAEAPGLYPLLVEGLRKIHVPRQELHFDPSSYPGFNDSEEKKLSGDLEVLLDTPPAEARTALEALETRHGERRSWVWMKLGMSPLAALIEPLARLARATGKDPGLVSLEEMAEYYAAEGWRADRAFLDVLSREVPPDGRKTVVTLAENLYRPWVERAAAVLQESVKKDGYPGNKRAQPEQIEEGTCFLFVDGLRWDAAESLRGLLEGHRLEVVRSRRWAALPTLTATGKPAVSPVETDLEGFAVAESPEPYLKGASGPLTQSSFRRALESRGFSLIGPEETGDPKARGWTEAGGIDSLGHNGLLVKNLQGELEGLAYRVYELLRAGWKMVRVVTDHGWLYLPSGLPKTELPGLLVLDKGERCAILKPGNPPTDLQIPWFWNPLVTFQAAPGISAFKAGVTYSHGGVSLQECVIPEMTVSLASGEPTRVSPAIEGLQWLGLRLKIAWASPSGDYSMDLRLAPNDPGTSVTGGAKPLGPSLLVADDELSGRAAVLVCIDPRENVVAQVPVIIGGG
jgi:hypothetical protein